MCRAADPDLAAQTLLTWAAERGLRLEGLEVRAATLEDLFLEHAPTARSTEARFAEDARAGENARSGENSRFAEDAR